MNINSCCSNTLGRLVYIYKTQLTLSIEVSSTSNADILNQHKIFSHYRFHMTILGARVFLDNAGM